MAFSSGSVVTSSLLLRRWVRPPHSVMPDEAAALMRPESLWMSARASMGDVWDAECERLQKHSRFIRTDLSVLL